MTLTWPEKDVKVPKTPKKKKKSTKKDPPEDDEEVCMFSISAIHLTFGPLFERKSLHSSETLCLF